MKKRVKNKLNDRMEIRLSTFEKNQIKGRAKLYAKGNVSLFVVHQALESDPKFLTEDSLFDSRRHTK